MKNQALKMALRDCQKNCQGNHREFNDILSCEYCMKVLDEMDNPERNKKSIKYSLQVA